MAGRSCSRSLFVLIAGAGMALPAMAQPAPWTVRIGGGLGVGLGTFPAMADYVNAVGRPAPADRMQDFVSVAELQLSGAVRVVEGWAIGIDYAFLSKQIDAVPSAPESGAQFTASITMPTVMLRKTLSDEGLLLEAAAGAGRYAGTFTERYAAYGAEQTYSGAGLGILLEAGALTPFDEHFYGTARFTLRWSFVGPLTDASGRRPSSAGYEADLHFVEPGLALGLAYQW